MSDSPGGRSAEQPQTLDVGPLNPHVVQESPWRPSTHRELVRDALAAGAIILAATALAIGAFGAFTNNEMAVNLAEASLNALWKVLLIVFGFYFLVPGRSGMETIQALSRWFREAPGRHSRDNPAERDQEGG